MIKIVVRDKVMVRVGIHGWNVRYRGSIILFYFIHNPACSKGTRKVIFCVPMERFGT